MNGSVAFWVEAVMAVLLTLSGVFVVISAIGFLRCKTSSACIRPRCVNLRQCA